MGHPSVTPAVVHLSGRRRGLTEVIEAENVSVWSSPASGVLLADGSQLHAGEHHAVLRRRGSTYEMRVVPGHRVWVNGEAVDQLVLASGDVLEIGKGGPVLRFRLYPGGTAGAAVQKSVRDVFSDCVECARHASQRPLERVGVFLAQVPRELATQTSGAFRTGVVSALLLLAGTTAVLARRNQELEHAISAEMARVSELATPLTAAEPSTISETDIGRWRSELSAEVAEAARRVEALEARTGAAGRVIAEAQRSITFLQGAYGFRDPASGRPLRRVVGPDGSPLSDPRGSPILTLDGDGPVFEVLYTGTGFLVSADGLLVTNRHVARPWEFDPAAIQIRAGGLAPEMIRLVGFLPGLPEPFAVAAVATHDQADVALLRCSGVTDSIPHLRLARREPSQGDEVLVLGYPLGLRALLARVEPEVARAITSEGHPDYWETARRLGEGGHVQPLATRGIVGQITRQFVVYDAETTSGGSGGPVLNLDGEVVAVNTAILPEFGGSNLGVPVQRARALLEASGAR